MEEKQDNPHESAAVFVMSEVASLDRPGLIGLDKQGGRATRAPAGNKCVVRLKFHFGQYVKPWGSESGYEGLLTRSDALRDLTGRSIFVVRLF